jgi:hypothetical protein
MLKIQCIHELEEWWKTKENGYSNEDGPLQPEWILKYAKAFNDSLSASRDRLPHKHEDIYTWRVLLSQRGVFFKMLVKRFKELFSKALDAADLEGEAGRLVMFTDLHYNQLLLARQERRFNIYSSGEEVGRLSHDLLPKEEACMAVKESVLYKMNFLRSPELALSELTAALPEFEDPKHEPLKLSLMLLRAQIHQRAQNY